MDGWLCRLFRHVFLRLDALHLLVILRRFFFRFRKSLNLAENLHKFFAGNRLFFNQEISNLVKSIPVFHKKPLCLFIGIFQDNHNFLINLGCRDITAV